MKYLQKFSKRLLYAMLSILLISVISVPAFADSWIPPNAIKDDMVLSMLDTPDGRKNINLFLSNFSEANLEKYGDGLSGDGAPSLYTVDFLYKHIELNASSYKDVVIKNDGISGKIMSIPLATFVKASKTLLGLDVDSTGDKPESGKDYNNGYFNVTADQVNSPKKVFSVASGSIKYVGHNIYYIYQVDFVIYKTDSKIDNSFYCYTAKEATKVSSLKKIGDGTADFIYVGGSGPSAFELYGYSLKQFDKSELLYTEANKPVKTDIATTAASEESTVSPSVTTTAKDKATISDTVGQSNTRALIFLTVAVALAAVAATVLIVKVYKKKE